jgi:hypothetical protein
MKILTATVIILLLSIQGLDLQLNAQETNEQEKPAKGFHMFHVTESGDTITISSPRVNVPPSGKTRETTANITDYFSMEIGVDYWMPNDDYRIGPDGNVDPFEQRYGNSTNLNIFSRQRFSLINNYLNLDYGIGVNFHKIMFDNPVILKRESNQINFELADGSGGEKVPIKTRLSYSYLTVPLLLNFESNPENANKSFRISAGVYGGTRLGSNFKQKFNNANRDNIKEKNHFHLAPFRWGLAGQIGYGSTNLYVNYSMTDVFKEKRNGGYEIGMVSAGLTINIY